MADPKRQLTVFISSTYLDNAERRRVVEDAVLQADMLPIGMERFTASHNPTVDECERKACDCDVYVGIVAHRYGWIPDGRDVAITEIEYDAAKAADRPRLMFEVDESVLIDQTKDFDDGVDRWQKQELLAAFKAKYAKDQMPARFKDTTLGQKVLHALNQWRTADEDKASDDRARQAPAPPDDGEEVARYCAAAEALHASLELAGFKTRLRVPIDLEELYVPLHAMVDLRGVGDAEFADAADAETRLRKEQAAREISLIEAFREAGQRKRRGLVILGDPGSGKTTHLKRLLLWCLRERAEELDLAADMLPVFLPLRNLDELSSGLDTFIERELDGPHLKTARGFGRKLLQRSRLLLLFDGLDEVTDVDERAEVVRWIDEATHVHTDCVPVVTCRFAGYGGDARLSTQFLELHLRPLTREQSESFIRNWYRAVEMGLAPDPDQGEMIANTRAEELVSRLRKPDYRAARMLEMTRNPLLLANLCLVHRDRGALPRGRARLYAECIEVLLERWREGKGMAVNLSAEIGQRVLQPAALWLHGEEERTRASAEALSPVLEPALQNAQWQGGKAADFLRTVRDDSGLLTGWSQDEYGFMHLGFQEYLAACEIRRLAAEGDISPLRQLARRYGESWWQEVILVLLSLSNPSMFVPFMREVVKRDAFVEVSDLLDMILEDAVEVSPVPFVELVKAEPGTSKGHWIRQLYALRVLKRLGQDALLDDLTKELSNHPVQAVQDWLDARRSEAQRMADQTITHSARGGVELVLVPGGSFTMGSPHWEQGRYKDEGPQRNVMVLSLYVGKYPVTNEQYARFLKADSNVREPEYWSDRRFNHSMQPVVGVSWEDAQAFASWAGSRLPSEVEWEYACRARTSTARWWGDEVGRSRANFSDSGSEWSGKQTSPVDAFEPNPFGLHDMLGNVFEWNQDCWHDNYESLPADGTPWLKADQGDCGRRVIRGGCWDVAPEVVRSSCRGRLKPATRSFLVGFRLAQDIE